MTTTEYPQVLVPQSTWSATLPSPTWISCPQQAMYQQQSPEGAVEACTTDVW